MVCILSLLGFIYTFSLVLLYIGIITQQELSTFLNYLMFFLFYIVRRDRAMSCRFGSWSESFTWVILHLPWSQRLLFQSSTIWGCLPRKLRRYGVASRTFERWLKIEMDGIPPKIEVALIRENRELITALTRPFPIFLEKYRQRPGSNPRPWVWYRALTNIAL